MRLIDRYTALLPSLHAVASPKNRDTLHYRGNAEFMVSGKTISRRHLSKPEMP